MSYWKSEIMKRELIRSIPAGGQKKRGWRLEINGTEVPDVVSMRLVNPRFGELAYGLTPGGWDGWVFHEVGGGGSVMVPVVFIGSNTYPHIGLLLQKRDNAGGEVLNVPRGFLDLGETHFGTAQREVAEEMGLATDLSTRLVSISDLINPNSTFFVNSGPGEGIKFFALCIAEKEIEPVVQVEPVARESNAYRFKRHLIIPLPKQAKGIMKCTFVPWDEAATTGDMFTLAGLGLVSAHLDILRDKASG